MMRTIDRSGKLKIFFLIFAGVWLAFGIYALIVRFGMHMEYPHGSFLFFRNDMFKDYATINEAVKERNPYLSLLSNYPPFILFIAYFFTRFSSPDSYHAPLEESFKTPAVMVSFIILIAVYAVSMLLIAWFFSKAKKDRKTNILVMLMLLLSAPSVFMIDRGNYLMVTVIFFMLFAAYEYLHPEKEQGAVFAALAAATKIYPAYVLLMYPVNKRFKKFLIAVATGAFVTILPIFFMRGSFMDNLYGFVTGALGFNGGVGYYSVYFNVGFTGLISFIYRAAGTTANTALVRKLWLLAAFGMTVLVFFFTAREKKLWKKLLVIISVMVFITPNSFLYNLTYLIPPVFLMLTDKEETERKEIPYVVFSSLLMVPKAFFYLKDLEGGVPLDFNTVNIAVFLDAMLLLAIFAYYIIEKLIEWKIVSKVKAILVNDKITSLILKSCVILLVLWFLYFLRDTVLACHDSFLEFIYARTESVFEGYRRAMEFCLARGRIGVIFPFVVSLRYLINGTGNYVLVWLLQYVPILCAVGYIGRIVAKRTRPVYGWFFSLFFFIFLQIDIWHSLITCYPLDFMYGLIVMVAGLDLYWEWLLHRGEKKNCFRIILSVFCYYESMQAYEPFLTAAAVYALLTFAYIRPRVKEKGIAKSLWEFVKCLIPHFITAVVFYGILKIVAAHPIVDIPVTSIEERGTFTGFLKAYKVYSFSMFPMRSLRFVGKWYSFFWGERFSKHAFLLLMIAFAGTVAAGALIISKAKAMDDAEARKTKRTLAVLGGSGFMIGTFYAMPHAMTSNYQYWVTDLHTSGYVPSTICYFGWALFLSMGVCLFLVLIARKGNLIKICSVTALAVLFGLGAYLTSITNGFFKQLPASTGTWTSHKGQTFYALVTDKNMASIDPDIIYVPDFSGVHGNMGWNDLLADSELGYDVDLEMSLTAFRQEIGGHDNPMEFIYDDDAYIGFLVDVDDFGTGRSSWMTSEDVYIVSPQPGTILVTYEDRSGNTYQTTIRVKRGEGVYLVNDGTVDVATLNAQRLN